MASWWRSLGRVLVVGLALTLTSGGGHRKAARPAPATSLTTTSLATPGLSWQTPDTVVASQSPVQVADDQQLAQESAQDPGLAQLEAMKVPAPAISGGWPRLAVANSPETWATEFVTGLLDIDYARPVANRARPMAAGRRGAAAHPRDPGQRRRQRAVRHRSRSRGWYRSPGRPSQLASQWASNARSGVRQTVSDLLTQSDPQWQQLISSGWQPPDARSAVIDVSGLLTVTRGSKSTITHFTMAVGTGSARWHAGYGTAEVEEWRS